MPLNVGKTRTLLEELFNSKLLSIFIVILCRQFLRLPKKDPRPKWTIHKLVSVKSKQCPLTVVPEAWELYFSTDIVAGKIFCMYVSSHSTGRNFYSIDTKFGTYTGR